MFTKKLIPSYLILAYLALFALPAFAVSADDSLYERDLISEKILFKYLQHFFDSYEECAGSKSLSPLLPIKLSAFEEEEAVVTGKKVDGHYPFYRVDGSVALYNPEAKQIIIIHYFMNKGYRDRVYTKTANALESKGFQQDTQTVPDKYDKYNKIKSTDAKIYKKDITGDRRFSEPIHYLVLCKSELNGKEALYLIILYN